MDLGRNITEVPGPHPSIAGVHAANMAVSGRGGPGHLGGICRRPPREGPHFSPPVLWAEGSHYVQPPSAGPPIGAVLRAWGCRPLPPTPRNLSGGGAEAVQ